MASVVMVMITDVIVHGVLRKGKGKIVDHIEISIFHQRSTDLNKNEHEIGFLGWMFLMHRNRASWYSMMSVARRIIIYAGS